MDIPCLVKLQPIPKTTSERLTKWRTVPDITPDPLPNARGCTSGKPLLPSNVVITGAFSNSASSTSSSVASAYSTPWPAWMTGYLAWQRPWPRLRRLGVSLGRHRAAGLVVKGLFRHFLRCDVYGDLHEDRAGATLAKRGERPAHNVADLVGRVDALCVFGHPGKVSGRVEMARNTGPFPRVAGGHKQNRRRVGIGGGYAGKGVFGAGPILHRRDPRAPPVGDPAEPVGNADADPFLPAYYGADTALSG